MGSFRRGDVKHVLLSSVTGEAALAGQGAERTRGEPSSLTKAESMLGIFSFYPNLAVPPISYNPHFAFHPSLRPINQPPLSSSSFLFMPISTFNKTAWSLFSREFIMSYFSINIIPLNMLQAISQSLLPASLSDIHPAA